MKENGCRNIGDAESGEVLKQALRLHRGARALHKELQLAELALGKDSSETNFGRLNDIRAQLPALGGIEAAVDGCGARSGRPAGILCVGETGGLVNPGRPACDKAGGRARLLTMNG